MNMFATSQATIASHVADWGSRHMVSSCQSLIYLATGVASIKRGLNAWFIDIGKSLQPDWLNSLDDLRRAQTPATDLYQQLFILGGGITDLLATLPTQ